MSTEWSQWLDFDRANTEAVPESPGVYVMHASMKILYIGAGQNVRQELASRLSDQCTARAKRFRYIVTPAFEAVKEQQVNEYVGKHGKLPPCMEQNAL
jgi:excinuclease UvrABC nuclease subunit